MQPFRVDSGSQRAVTKLSAYLAPILASRRDVVFVCFGTPEVPGDAFGPLVGSMLSRALPVPVYGTVEKPVTDPDLKRLHRTLAARHRAATVIALDSALGSARMLKQITVAKGGVHPGRGVGKRRVSVGDYRIKAVVGRRTEDPVRTLEQTPLRGVKRMARITVEAIVAAQRTGSAITAPPRDRAVRRRGRAATAKQR